MAILPGKYALDLAQAFRDLRDLLAPLREFVFDGPKAVLKDATLDKPSIDKAPKGPVGGAFVIDLTR